MVGEVIVLRDISLVQFFWSTSHSIGSCIIIRQKVSLVLGVMYMLANLRKWTNLFLIVENLKNIKLVVSLMTVPSHEGEQNGISVKN